MQKFYGFIGKMVLQFIGFSGVIIISVVLTGLFYETEKEDLFFQASDYFYNLYEVEKESILNDHGLSTHKEIMDAQYNQTYKI